MTTFRYLWPATVWSLIILILTLIPGKDIPEVDVFQIDKLVHFFVFGVLMILSAYGLYKTSINTITRSKPLLISTLYSVGLGITIEILQRFVPGRNFSIADIIANSIGVGLGYLIIVLLRRRNLFSLFNKKESE